MRVREEAAWSLWAPKVERKPLRPAIGIAVRAGWRDPRTAPPRVERMMSPFNSAVLCHIAPAYRLQVFLPSGGGAQRARIVEEGVTC